MQNTFISKDFTGPFVLATYFLSTLGQKQSVYINTSHITYITNTICSLEHFEISNKNKLGTYKYLVM